MTLSTYSVREMLRDGRPIEIRALRPSDEAGMLAAIDRTNSESLRRRFFVTKRGFSEEEKAFFLNVDFVDHVALVATIEEDGQQTIIAGARYIVTEHGKGEVAFVVIDAFQGKGIGAILTRHSVNLARANGVKELSADVLPENAAMRKVLGKSGFHITRSHDPQIVHMTLTLTGQEQEH